jgi:hypothetical protein
VTATSRGASALSAAVALLAAAGCAGAGMRPRPEAGQPPPADVASFTWLREQAAPTGWADARAPDGSVLAHPAGWRQLAGDRGSISAALQDRDGRYLGYLNLTPREGAERAAGWASFRARHNRAEGDRHVQILAGASGLRFRTGSGACVEDSYVTATSARFTEIACLVEGRRSAVIVGAAPPAQWPAEVPTIERAIAAARV